MTSLTLWKMIITHQGETFVTTGRGSRPGIEFTYSVSQMPGKGGRHYGGEEVTGYGNEMRVTTSEGEKKKSISRSTVDRALARAEELQGRVSGPKALNVPGAHSYLYPIFARFGVISSTIPGMEE